MGWDGLDEASARRALTSQRLSAHAPPPPWAKTLKDALRLYEFLPLDAENRDRAVLAHEPIPFEEVLLPFVALGRYRLLEGDGRWDQLSDGALASLERSLLLRLAELFRLPLYQQFKIHLALQQSRFSHSPMPTEDAAGDSVYAGFLARMRSEEIVSFFLAFPVLARLAAQATDSWVETSAEFLDRLAADREAIQTEFSNGASLGAVEALGCDLSDAHHGGRSVVAVRFESGLKLIYKPRELALERAYFSLLNWLDGRGNPLPFRSLRVLERSGYGWVEFASNTACETEGEVDNYYRRAGMLLCLVYTLGGTDFHFENVIASGQQLILIDLETIMHPKLSVPTEIEKMGGAHYLAQVHVQQGILGTGLLPWWVTNEQGATIDVSGLGGIDEQSGIDRIARWSDPNTDRMELTYEYGEITPSGNVVRLGEDVVSASDHVESIVAGFRAMHSILLESAEALLSNDSPLKGFSPHHVRFLLRDTRVYGILLLSALDCESLQDGARRSIELDILSKPLLGTAEPNRLWALLRSEQAALERQDIPFFSAPASENGITLESGGSLQGCFVESPLECAHAKLRALKDDDVDALSQLIRAALKTRVAINGADVAEPDDEADRGEPPTAQDLYGHATEIAETMRDQAIRSPEGDVSWIGLGYLPMAERFQLQATGPDLYSGYTGIALFFAAYAKATGDISYSELALQALHVLRREVRLDKVGVDDFVSSAGLGAATGSVSVVYALLRIGQLLDDASLVDDARFLARHITRQHIADDSALDVVSGAAGAILGLLALFDTTAEGWVLDLAAACGQHLLHSRVVTPLGHTTWHPRSVPRPLSGFAHGAAGISFALLRLAERTNDDAYIQAAMDGIAYEQSLFLPSAGNWRDLRDSSGSAPLEAQHCTAWCHGAPGITLARLGGLAVLETAQIRADIEIGLQTTQRFGIGGVDHLCCGGMGRVDILIEAAQRLNRPELLQVAHRQAGWVVNRAQRTGSYRTQSGQGMTDPGFFSGLGGIGYTLLRLASPEPLPSVLLWS